MVNTAGCFLFRMTIDGKIPDVYLHHAAVAGYGLGAVSTKSKSLLQNSQQNQFLWVEEHTERERERAFHHRFNPPRPDSSSGWQPVTVLYVWDCCDGRPQPSWIVAVPRQREEEESGRRERRSRLARAALSGATGLAASSLNGDALLYGGFSPPTPVRCSFPE